MPASRLNPLPLPAVTPVQTWDPNIVRDLTRLPFREAGG